MTEIEVIYDLIASLWAGVLFESWRIWKQIVKTGFKHSNDKSSRIEIRYSVLVFISIGSVDCCNKSSTARRPIDNEDGAFECFVVFIKFTLSLFYEEYKTF